MKLLFTLFLLLTAGQLAAGSIAPDWAELIPRQGTKALLLQNRKKQQPLFPVRLVTEPDRTRSCGVKVSCSAAGLELDLRKLFDDRVRKLNLSFLTVPDRKFPASLYQLALSIQGPKEAMVELYFEGKDLEGSHFYHRTSARLSGRQERLTFAESLPKELRELHLRFDLHTPGIYRISGVEFSPVEVAAPAGKAELLFYLPFDNSVEAAVAAGDPAPAEMRNIQFAPGIKGDALRSTKAAGTLLRYRRAGNFLRNSGTITLWFKPEWGEKFIGTTGDPSTYRALVSMERPVLRRGSGAVWFWCWGNMLRGDQSDPGDRYQLAGARMLKSDRWYHLAFSWNAAIDEKKLYIDGCRADSRREEISTLRPRPLLPGSGLPELESFFVGSYLGATEQADGLIDEVRIYSAPLAEREIALQAAQFRPLSIRLESPFIAPGDGKPLTFSAVNMGEKAISFQWSLEDALSRQVAGSNGKIHLPPGGHERITVVPKHCTPGRCAVRFSGAGDDFSIPFWKLHGRSPLEAAPGKLQLEPVDRVMPDPALGNERFLSIGKLRKGVLDGRPYLEAGKERGDRFAVRFHLPEIDSPYLVEWEFPDDAKRTCDFIAQSSKLQTSEYELQVGCAAGDEYPNSGKMLTQKCIYFPRSRDITLVFMSARKEAPAAAGEIRISRITSGLPDADVHSATPVRGRTRSVGIYYEDPAINNGFGVNGADPDQFETVIDRLIAYMKYSGQNLLAYPLVWYPGRITEACNPRNHTAGFVEAILSKFDAAGLEFMATMNQNDMISSLEINRRNFENGSLHSTEVAIHDTGKPNSGGWHGTPPNYNILHPAVQKEVMTNVKNILKAGVPHPSFKGIVLHLPRHAMLWFGDIKSGYNDYAIEAFERETGIRVPVNRKEPMRGKLYAEWLLKNVRSQWIDWRCRKLAEFYRGIAAEMAAARPDLLLIINSMIPSPEIGASNYTESDFVETKNREAGLDPRYYRDLPNVALEQTVYPADYRFRSGKPIRPEVHRALRTLDMKPEYYELLRASGVPWLHMHDRYWESAIGASGIANHWSDKPNTLKAPWLNEQHWRVSTINPAGVHAMRHYVLPLRFADLQGITKGGFLVGTYGMEPWLVPFSKAFRALPALLFHDLQTGSETLCARYLNQTDTSWFYVVNTTEKPAICEVKTDRTPVIDAVSGNVVGGKKSRFLLRLAPWQLRSFRIAGLGATVEVRAK